MAPRTYALRRRAETAATTRQRIVDAAAELYRDRGIAATSLQSVAQMADVSRGTILNHFGGADGLVDAVASHVLTELDLHDEAIFAGLGDRDARVRAFVAAMVAFFERSTPWWQVFASEMERPGLKEQETAYWETLERLQRAALGPAASSDRITMATVSGLLHPATMGALMWQLKTSGLAPDEVVAVLGDLVVGAVARAQDAPATN